jgi:hypothetical protein
MKGRVNSKQRLLGWMGIVFGFALSLIGLLLIAFETELRGMMIVGSSMLLWIGLGFSGLILRNMKTLELETQTITIGTFFGLVRKRYPLNDIECVNPKSFENQFGSYQGLLIKFRDGQQFHLHEMEFKNFRDFKNELPDNIARDTNLEIQMWTSYTKIFAACGALIVLLFVIVKIIGE